MIAITRYLNRTRPWTDELMGLKWQKISVKNSFVNLVDIWRDHIPLQDSDTSESNHSLLEPQLDGSTGLANLVLRVSSIVLNTVSAEQILDTFKAIHSAVRNRLSHEDTRKEALIRADVLRAYPLHLQGRKRKFGDIDRSQELTAGDNIDTNNSIESILNHGTAQVSNAGLASVVSVQSTSGIL